MTGYAWLQLGAVALVVAVLAPLLGKYLAAVHRPGNAVGDRVFLPIERLVYRLIGINESSGQSWRAYARSVVAFGMVSVFGLYLLLRLQADLPFNPTGASAVPPALAFNTAVSFVTGTNWQAYAGESTMSHLSQMAGLVVAQFTAAAVGMSVGVAVVRGLAHYRNPSEAATEPDPPLGNFWVDLTRNTVRVLLPIAAVATIVLVSQGAVQNLRGDTRAVTLEGNTQFIPGGPVASQEVMKTLGTNGGGFLNASSAHPFANPNGLTNTFELVLVLTIPFAFPFMFGQMVGRRRAGYTIAIAMSVLWLLPIVVASTVEGDGNPRLGALGVDQQSTSGQPGGNMEGKELRFGPAGSATLTIGTMGTSAGITNSALDSYTPTGGASALGPILLGEVSPGGVGTGLVGMLIYAIVAVFVGGLMVGRTPQYLGKMLGATEVKLVAVYLLVVPVVVLAGTGVSVLLDSARRSALNEGFHGFTEIFYAFASAANGNGSAFAGLNANTAWYNSALGVVMLAGRFLPIIAALALAGSLARARVYADSSATMPSSGPTFGVLLLAIVIVLGGLAYLPALALGPIAEQLGI